MAELITDYDKEWSAWVELFELLWPRVTGDEIAEMANRMLYTFGSNSYRTNVKNN